MTPLARRHYACAARKLVVLAVSAFVASVAAAQSIPGVSGQVLDAPVSWAVVLAAVGVGANAVIRAIKELRSIKRPALDETAIADISRRYQETAHRMTTLLERLAANEEERVASVIRMQEQMVQHAAAAEARTESLRLEIKQGFELTTLRIQQLPSNLAVIMGQRLAGPPGAP